MAELLSPEAVDSKLSNFPEWGLHEGKTIRREYQFADFAEAMKFVNRVAEIAEDMNHHPDIDIRWNKVTLSISTHSIGGLTENDFELAQKTDATA